MGIANDRRSVQFPPEAGAILRQQNGLAPREYPGSRFVVPGMGLLKLLGLSTKHEGQHSAEGQRGSHADNPPKQKKAKGDKPGKGRHAKG